MTSGNAVMVLQLSPSALGSLGHSTNYHFHSFMVFCIREHYIIELHLSGVFLPISLVSSVGHCLLLPVLCDELSSPPCIGGSHLFSIGWYSASVSWMSKRPLFLPAWKLRNIWPIPWRSFFFCSRF